MRSDTRSASAWKSVDPVVSLAMLDQVVGVFRVYDHHRAVLEGIGDDQIKDVARRWAGTEELSDWDPGDVEAVLIDLVRLARKARASGRGLYCWVSL